VSTDLRWFPKILLPHNAEQNRYIVLALSNCTNLVACKWTRDGTLTDDILRVLQSSPNPPLRELSINGRSGRSYDATTLLDFKHLTKLSLIMPDSDIARYLVDWCRSLGDTLMELTITCKATPFLSTIDLIH